MNSTEFGKAITTTVNSAKLNASNYCSDNTFIRCEAIDTVLNLKHGNVNRTIIGVTNSMFLW